MKVITLKVTLTQALSTMHSKTFKLPYGNTTLPLPRVADMTRYHNPTRPAHLKGGALVRRKRSYSPNEFKSVQAVGLEQSPAYFTKSTKTVHRAKSAPHRKYSRERENSREKSPSTYHNRTHRIPPNRRDSRSASRDRGRSKSPVAPQYIPVAPHPVAIAALYILYYINLFNIYKHLCIYTCSNLQLHLIYVYDRIPLNPRVVHKCVGKSCNIGLTRQAFIYINTISILKYFNMLIYEIRMNGMKMDYLSTIIIKPPRP